MPSLYNPTPYPSGLRRCFWDAEYIASQSFCITSKLTDKEAQIMADFEEMKFWERNEQMKNDLGFSEYDIQKAIKEIESENKQISIEKIAVLEMAKMREEARLESITSKLTADFRIKSSLKPFNFLTR